MVRLPIAISQRQIIVAWHPKSSTETNATLWYTNNVKNFGKTNAGAWQKECKLLKLAMKDSRVKGFIKFGSRVDCASTGYKVEVKINDKVKGGVTVG